MPSNPADAWSASAKKYEEYCAGYLAIYSRDALLLANPAGDSSVLDIGCGPRAAVSFLAASSHEPWQVQNIVATDAAAGCIQQAEERKKRQALCDPAVDGRLALRVVDGQTLDGIEDASMDYAFAMFSIFLFPDRLAGWRSARRVLKPNTGKLVASVWATEPNSRGDDAARVLQTLFAHIPERIMQKRKDSKLMEIGSASPLTKELHQSGFTQVDIYPVEHSHVLPDRRTLLNFFLEGSPVMGTAIGQCTEEEKKAVEAAVIQAAYQGQNKTEFPVVLNSRALIAVASYRE